MSAPTQVLDRALPTPGTDSRLSRLFWSKVTPQPDGCWHWTSHVMDNGYGRTSRQVAGVRQCVLVHRLVYEDQVGVIPEGLTIDHACHDSGICTLGVDCLHRRCVRPDHLRVMPRADNSARQWEERQEALDALPGGVSRFIADRRAAGDSWRYVSRALYDATGADVTEATLRQWAAS